MQWLDNHNDSTKDIGARQDCNISSSRLDNIIRGRNKLARHLYKDSIKIPERFDKIYIE